MISHRDVIAWADPWPISFRRCARPKAWRVRVRTVSQCLTYRTYWNAGHRVSARTSARKIAQANWLGKQHHIDSLARYGHLRRPVIMVRRGVIIDGNHTLLALALGNRRRKVLVLESWPMGRSQN